MPQRVAYIALHNDYSENFVASTDLSEDRCGEICVDRLLKANRGHYGCYSADTTVMTNRGWVPWPDVTPQDQLLAVDIETGISRFEIPKALIAQPVTTGDRLYHARSQQLDLLVTHDHRMIASSRKNNGKEWSAWAAAPAAEVCGKAVRYRVTTELESESRHLPDDLPADASPMAAMELAGFYFGDGVRSRSLEPHVLRFRFRRQRKINYLEELSGSVGVLTRRQDDRYSLDCGVLAAWVERHFKGPQGKVCPDWVLTLPRPEFLAFLEGLRRSDGTRFKEATTRGGSSWSLDCSEKSALELIQAACCLNGIAASLTLNNRNEGPGHENHRPCWRLHVSHDRDFARFEAAQQGRTHGTEEAVPYEGMVYCATVSTGALLVRRNGKPVVSGNCLEHPSLTLALRADHNTIVQLRTHRISSWDVQSMRYSGKRIEQVARRELPVEDVFYVRPPGTYWDRQGDKYEWNDSDAEEALAIAFSSAIDYTRLRERGVSEEQARSVLVTSYYQNAVATFSLRGWLHLLDVRLKADAQLEARQLMELIAAEVQRWAPEVYSWWASHRKGKAILAP